MKAKKIIGKLLILLSSAIFLRFGLLHFLESENLAIKIIALIAILSIGALFSLKKSAEIIEESTEVLSEKTKLAGGLLQSLGTAFPDMILGVTAAFVSLNLRHTDYERAINYAIIAAATTFGSNIYNIGHAAWCIYRQNLADTKNKKILMFPYIPAGGWILPIKQHKRKPAFAEIETSQSVLVALTILTAIVACSMVIFGKVASPPPGISEDLYQLSSPLGYLILFISIATLYTFRKAHRPGPGSEEAKKQEEVLLHTPLIITWFSLLIAGATILFTAESMVKSIEVFSIITNTPFVVAGILAGLIGCLGEMIVVHNFSVNQNGRIGDAIVGVAMDNIVTITGAAIVAIMGGIFLGGGSLILIFVIILSLNTILLKQISNLKNIYLNTNS